MSADAERDLPVAGTVVLLRQGAGGLEVLLMRRPGRGSFADAWVFPGGKVEHVDHRDGSSEQDDARRAGIRETREEVGLVIDDPTVLSRWQPPSEAPVRIRTWFFLAEAPSDEPTPSAHEVVEVVWTTPAAALSRHAAGEWTLYPPTWITLHGLSSAPSVEAALTAAGIARHFSTQVRETEQGTVFAWDDLRLETGVLPWRVVGG